MKNYNQASYQTLPRTGSLNRSKSQNLYYIRAGQFQKKYHNSLFNAYQLNSSRECSPCCNKSQQRVSENRMTFRQDLMQDQRGEGYTLTQYNENTNFGNQSNSQTLLNIQNSKRYLQQLLLKSQFNFRIHKQNNENQILSYQKLLQTKNCEIIGLNEQISLLKKKVIQSDADQGYKRQEQTSLSQLQNKEQAIKKLQKQVHRLRQQNSFYYQELRNGNKKIEQINSKFRIKEKNDAAVRKQFQSQMQTLKHEKKLSVQKNTRTQKLIHQKDEGIKIQKQRRKNAQNQLQIVRVILSQAKQNYDRDANRNIQKMKSLQNQFKMLRYRSNQKDMRIQAFLSKINHIQSQLDFIKNKLFTNLLFQIERQQRQQVIIFQQAQTLKQNRQEFYQQIQRIRQSKMIQLEPSKKIKQNGLNMFSPVEHKLVQSHIYNKNSSGKQSIFQFFQPKNSQRKEHIMMQSGFDFPNKFPSLNMSIQPIRNKQ